MSSDDINAINNALANIQSQINNITGAPLISYNQINRISSQQGNVYNSLYNGTGNLNASNLFVNNRTTISGNLVYPSISYTGNLTTPNGNLINSTLGNLILSNGNILSTRGNILLSNGNINNTRGNINLSNGNLRLAIGNVILSNGDANIGGALYSEGISTTAGQEAFKIQYDTTAIVDTNIVITFDTPFVNVPTVIASGFNNSAVPPIVYLRSISNTAVQLFAKDQAGSNYGNLRFTWVAFGV